VNIYGAINPINSVQNLLSSRLLSKNINIRIYKTIILPVILYGCETLSLTLREEHRLRRREMHIGYWWESQKLRDHWEDQDQFGGQY
jgi:hypothetical protein